MASHDRDTYLDPKTAAGKHRLDTLRMGEAIRERMEREGLKLSDLNEYEDHVFRQSASIKAWAKMNDKSWRAAIGLPEEEAVDTDEALNKVRQMYEKKSATNAA